MPPEIWNGLFTAFPATVAAVAAVIAALRSGTDPDIKRIRELLSAHIADTSIHSRKEVIP